MECLLILIVSRNEYPPPLLDKTKVDGYAFVDALNLPAFTYWVYSYVYVAQSKFNGALLTFDCGVVGQIPCLKV